MALDIGAIRTGYVTRLATVTGLRVYRTVAGDLAPPAAVIAPADDFLDYHMAHAKGLVKLSWRILVATSKTLEPAGQDLLDDYLSAGTGQTRSIIDAIEADRTLSGTVDDTLVSVARSYGPIQWNETLTYFGAELRAENYVDRQ